MQKLIYPQEIEVWYVLPAIRKCLALKLIEKGLSQKHVAVMMNSTEASISQYVKDKRADNKIFNAGFEKEIEKSASLIKDKKKTLNGEVMKLNEMVKKQGLICQVHKTKSPLNKKDLPCESCTHHKHE